MSFAAKVKEYQSVSDRAYGLLQSLVEVVGPVITAMGFKIYRITDITRYAGDLYSVDFEWADGDGGSVTIPASVLEAKDPVAAMNEHIVAKKAAEAAAFAAKAEANERAEFERLSAKFGGGGLPSIV